jgi:hypothetical protein
MATITPEQRREIENAGENPVRVEDLETHTAYVILREDVDQKLRRLPAEEGIDPSLYEFGDFEPLRQ